MIRTEVEIAKPKHDSSKELANKFADVFMDKVRKVCNNLSEHPKFSPAIRDIQRFNNWSK